MPKMPKPRMTPKPPIGGSTPKLPSAKARTSAEDNKNINAAFSKSSVMKNFGMVGPFFTGVGGKLMSPGDRMGRVQDIRQQKTAKKIKDFYGSAEYKKNLGETSKNVQ